MAASGTPRGRRAEIARLQAEVERLREVHEVAARFYRDRLAAEPSGGPSRYLRERDVPVDGPWVVGYAPDEPAALTKELRREGFGQSEIQSAGLAVTSEPGPLVDRFSNRVMVGIRDHTGSFGGVIGFVGYAPPRAGPDVARRLTSPRTKLYRPADELFGLFEQRERRDGLCVLARDPLEAITLSTRTAGQDDPPLVVSTSGDPLTPRQAVILSWRANVEAGFDLVAGRGSSREDAQRARRLLVDRLNRQEAKMAPTYGLSDTPSPLGEVRIVHADEVVARASRQADRPGAAREPAVERRAPDSHEAGLA
jgi:DNA primase